MFYNYIGKEDRNDPDFRWHKYLVRAVVTNLFAAYIALRITQYYMSMEIEAAKDGLGGESPAAIPFRDGADAEF